MGSTLVMAVALPVVVFSIEDPAIGIVLLATITGTSNTFDSIPARLMGVVTGGTQVTFLEGHQLTRQGTGAYSLGAVYAVSAIGGLVGAFLLLLAPPVLKPFILMVSFAEIDVLALFGIALVGILSRGTMLKGWRAVLSGSWFGTVGIQGFTGVDRRFTFGVFDLQYGLPLIATIIGVMAVPEMVNLALSRAPVVATGDVSTREILRASWLVCGDGSSPCGIPCSGVAVGAIPGTSAAVVRWLSYGLGIVLSKDRSQFGKGSGRSSTLRIAPPRSACTRCSASVRSSCSACTTA